MKMDEWLVTVNAVLEALPDSFEKEHADRLQTIRDILGLVLIIQKFNR
ncbi:hypothetical protein SPSIL_033780 [Sporomusa silvacetica DSM 10669]|uniref:Uncharacterized protein n=1 Tax=Sporomusa silvacetica DSM 10669 TaxID=1123289 RepID=A0ABZ3INF8_9FIRM|nr:hypothetical protein [Sporomusa silvacetica]OZC14681.1 hypothetical protein SPSIL_45120 [Sporomusa silvacetica DSM 10669]